MRAVVVVLIVAALLPGAAAGRGRLPARPTSITPFPARVSAVRAETPNRYATGTLSRTVARILAQVTLGEPVAATVELLTGRRTGYLFNASGKQTASKTVSVKVVQAASATRRLRRGASTYYLLNWGPLAGYWVQLSSAVRLVAPTTWKTLVLVYRQTNLDFINGLGEVRHLQATMTPDTEACSSRRSGHSSWSMAGRQELPRRPRPSSIQICR
ncbi:MAG: hypothetical protein WD830_01135 [Chloroflexota bacterium]